MNALWRWWRALVGDPGEGIRGTENVVTCACGKVLLARDLAAHERSVDHCAGGPNNAGGCRCTLPYGARHIWRGP